MAIDLPNRFGQHTGLVGCPKQGCKRAEIDGWFKRHDMLGYSVMLQTSNIQPVGRRRAQVLGIKLKAREGLQDDFLDPLPGELADFEGRIIEHHRLNVGVRPPWNAVGGSTFGAAQAQGIGEDDLFRVLTGVKDSPLVARRSIRELAHDDTAMTYEEHLHTARIHSVMYGRPGTSLGIAEFQAVLEQVPDGPLEAGARLKAAGYLTQPAPFSAS